jgi:hypothetical protein
MLVRFYYTDPFRIRLKDLYRYEITVSLSRIAPLSFAKGYRLVTYRLRPSNRFFINYVKFLMYT